MKKKIIMVIFLLNIIFGIGQKELEGMYLIKNFQESWNKFYIIEKEILLNIYNKKRIINKVEKTPSPYCKMKILKEYLKNKNQKNVKKIFKISKIIKKENLTRLFNEDKKYNMNKYIIKNDSKKIKLAYNIYLHKNFELSKLIFLKIFNKIDIYIIHIDKKNLKLFKKFSKFIKKQKTDNVYVYNKYEIIWGNFNMIKMMIKSMKLVFDEFPNTKIDYLINISGNDYPLKSNDEIKNILSYYKNNLFKKNVNYMSYNNMNNMMNNEKIGYVECEGYSYSTFYKIYNSNLKYFGGSQWFYFFLVNKKVHFTL
jgi:hypothetical protein